MSSSRATVAGLYARALHEALEGAAGPERAEVVLTTALTYAGLPVVPEDLEAFRRFTEGALLVAVGEHLSPTENEAIFELVRHVLWMATSDVQSRNPPSDAEEKEEGSGQRFVDALPFRMPELPPTPIPDTGSSPAISAEEVDTAQLSPVRERRGSVTLGRVARPAAPRGGVIEIGPNDSPDGTSRRRPVSLEVLVLTLDPQLVFETDNGLDGRGRVTAIGTPAELARWASAATAQLIVVVDSALPSIDLPTFAPISGSLPPGTRIVLWGVDERQKHRLSVMFPAAKDWIASGRAASPAEVILDL
jgi:hypothetical protein